MPATHAVWLAEADALMLREYCIDLADAGLGDEDITRFAPEYPNPRDFVEWWGRKYDLESVREINFGRYFSESTMRRLGRG